MSSPLVTGTVSSQRDDTIQVVDLDDFENEGVNLPVSKRVKLNIDVAQRRDRNKEINQNEETLKEEGEKEEKEEEKESEVEEKKGSEHELCVQRIVDVLDKFKSFVKSKDYTQYSCLEDMLLIESNLTDWLDDLCEGVEHTKEDVEHDDTSLSV
mgnify:CR=1 FL=1